MTFSEFCATFRVSKTERNELVEYLAFIRSRNTIKALKGSSDG